MSQLIPLTSDGARRVSVDLGNDRGVFTFRTYWNYTTNAWNLDITDSAGADVILGLALVVDIDLLAPFPEVSTRIGELQVASINTVFNRGTEELGANSFLLQFEPGELEAAAPISDILPTLIIDAEDVIQSVQ